jgi:hypothetical protein
MRLFGTAHRGVLATNMDIAHALSAAGRHDEAIVRGREALERAATVLGAQHAETLRFRSHLAELLLADDGATEAEAVARPALDAPVRQGALAVPAALLASTLSSLDAWARSLDESTDSDA